MTPSRAIRIVTEVAKVLDYAHARGVVHQDIKPSNILLGDRPRGQQERVMLADFGAACTFDESADPSSGPMIASLAYAAPEVIAGNCVDGQADVYSLGCTLFRLLTGRYPFPAMRTFRRPSRHISISPRCESPTISPGPAHSSMTSSPRPWPKIPLSATPRPENLPPAPGTPSMPPRPPCRRTRHRPQRKQAAVGRAASAAAVDFIGHLPRTQPVASRRRILAAVAIAAALIAVGLVVWLALPAREPTRSTPSSTTSATTDPAAAGKLADVVPPGYPAGSCTPAAINADLAGAAVSCGPALSPEGPPTATYTLARNRTALQALFAQQTAAATAVVCPGNIQSPGPRHRVANPTVPVGTVFCGLKSGRPVVAWTTDDKLLMATIEAKAPYSPALDQLYTWWASHS